MRVHVLAYVTRLLAQTSRQVAIGAEKFNAVVEFGASVMLLLIVSERCLTLTQTIRAQRLLISGLLEKLTPFVPRVRDLTKDALHQ